MINKDIVDPNSTINQLDLLTFMEYSTQQQQKQTLFKLTCDIGQGKPHSGPLPGAQRPGDRLGLQVPGIVLAGRRCLTV